MESPFRGQIDVDVLRRTNRAALTPSSRTLIFGGVVALSVIWGLVVPWLQGEPASWEGLWPLLVFALLFAGIIGYALYVGPRKVLQSSKLMQATISGEAKESGIRMETEHPQSEFPWDVFPKRKITKDIVLLYQSIQVTNVFPREFFASENDWQAFVELVRQNVPEGAPQSRGGILSKIKILFLWMAIFFVIILLWNLFHH